MAKKSFAMPKVPKIKFSAPKALKIKSITPKKTSSVKVSTKIPKAPSFARRSYSAKKGENTSLIRESMKK